MTDTPLKPFLAGVAATYLVVAVMTGAALGHAIRPLNALGKLYVGATWPVAMFCAAIDAPCSALPPEGSPLANALFTFAEPKP